MTETFVVIEGLDFVGKTTLARELAKRTGWIYYKTPPEPFVRRCTTLSREDVNGCFLFFMESMAYASLEIKKLRQGGIGIVADRWIWTTLAYHFARSDDLRVRWENSWLDLVGGDIARPDLSILLHLPDHVWLARVRSDGSQKSLNDRQLENNKVLRDRIFRLYLHLNPEFVLLDNSGSVESTVCGALTLLPRMVGHH